MLNIKQVGRAAGAIAFGIVGGLAAASIINYLTRPTCPMCKQKIDVNTKKCSHCGTYLEWC